MKIVFLRETVASKLFTLQQNPFSSPGEPLKAGRQQENCSGCGRTGLLRSRQQLHPDSQVLRIASKNRA